MKNQKEITPEEQLIFDIKSKLFDWGIIDKQSLRDLQKNELINKACTDIAKSILTKPQKDEIVIGRGKVKRSYSGFSIGSRNVVDIIYVYARKYLGKNIILTVRVVKNENIN